MEDKLRRMAFFVGPLRHKEISLAARARGIKIPELLSLSVEFYIEMLNGEAEHQARVVELIEEDRAVLDQI